MPSAHVSTCNTLNTVIQAKHVAGDDSDTEYHADAELIPHSDDGYVMVSPVSSTSSSPKSTGFKNAVTATIAAARARSGSNSSSSSSGKHVEISAPFTGPYRAPSDDASFANASKSNKGPEISSPDIKINTYSGSTVSLEKAKQKFGAGSGTTTDSVANPPSPPSQDAASTTHGLFPSGLSAHGGAAQPPAFDPAAALAGLKKTPPKNK